MRTLSLRSSPLLVGAVFMWIGRLAAALLLLFWGGFFVEHLFEWFLHPGGGFSPVWVGIAQVFHLAMLVGLALMLKWQTLGSLVTTVGTAGFVFSVGDWYLLSLALINVVPMACFAISRLGPAIRNLTGC